MQFIIKTSFKCFQFSYNQVQYHCIKLHLLVRHMSGPFNTFIEKCGNSLQTLLSLCSSFAFYHTFFRGKQYMQNYSKMYTQSNDLKINMFMPTLY